MLTSWAPAAVGSHPHEPPTWNADGIPHSRPRGFDDAPKAGPGSRGATTAAASEPVPAAPPTIPKPEVLSNQECLGEFLGVPEPTEGHYVSALVKAAIHYARASDWIDSAQAVTKKIADAGPPATDAEFRAVRVAVANMIYLGKKASLEFACARYAVTPFGSLKQTGSRTIPSLTDAGWAALDLFRKWQAVADEDVAHWQDPTRYAESVTDSLADYRLRTDALNEQTSLVLASIWAIGIEPDTLIITRTQRDSLLAEIDAAHATGPPRFARQLLETWKQFLQKPPKGGSWKFASDSLRSRQD